MEVKEQQYDNNNSGALFKNQKKVTEKQPEYTGDVEVGGSEYWLSAWVKTSKAGRKYFSLSFTPKNDKPAQKPVTPSLDDADVSDIPF